MEKKPKKVLGYSKRFGTAYILIEPTLSGDLYMVSTSRGWPQVWFCDRRNIEVVNGFKLPPKLAAQNITIKE